MRRTSIDAYRRIRNEGLLSKARFDVYSVLFTHGPLTAGEIFSKCQQDNSGHTVVKGSVCARLTELNRQGVVEEVGERECGLTHHNAILWDVTPDLPRTLVKTKKVDPLEVANKRLLIAVKALEAVVNNTSSYSMARLYAKGGLEDIERVAPVTDIVTD